MPRPVPAIPIPAMCAASSICALASRSAPSAQARGRFAAIILITCSAMPSDQGLARMDRKDSSAWVSASRPVAAVAAAGRPAVSSGSRIAAAGRVLAWPT